ncbi:MAG TPA: amidohydrolase [Acidimicrobiales bacterium]|nr:amidohydrolase [Acidimicrobiales bacterium]
MRVTGECFEAVAIRGDGIVAVGPGESILDLTGTGTRVIDLQGATVLPGFIDPHVHITDDVYFDTDLRMPSSKQELLRAVKAKAAAQPPDSWLICYAPTTDKQVWPNRREFDAVSEGHPGVVLLSPNDFLLNTRAQAEMLPDAKNRFPGKLELAEDSQGPTGMIRTSGVAGPWPVLPNAPVGSKNDLRRSILRGMGELAMSGITTVHPIVTSGFAIEVFQDLLSEGILPTRAGLLLRAHESAIDLDDIIRLGIRQGFGGDWLKLQGVKVSVDGYFAEGSAAFTEGYEDEPDNCGILRIAPEELDGFILRAHRAGLRCAVHANGDRAVGLSIDAYERALQASPRADHRHRIEHIGNLYLTDVHAARMRQLGIVAVPNPPFLHEYARFMDKRLGSVRGHRPVAIRTLLEAGVRVVTASDFAGLHPPDPLLGISALVTRSNIHGEIYAPQEGVDADTALQLCTSEAAWLGFEEAQKGSIEPGKLADFAILSDDPVTIDPDQIAKCAVLATVVGGRVVFARDEFKETIGV